MLTALQYLSVGVINSNIKSKGLKKDVLITDQLLSLLLVLLIKHGTSRYAQY